MTQPKYSNTGFLQPIEIRQGADLVIQLVCFEGEVNGEPYDLTGAEVKALLKKGTDEYAFVVPDFTATAADGIATITLPKEVTATLELSPESKMAAPDYYWWCDIKLGDGTVVPYCHGPATVFKGAIEW